MSWFQGHSCSGGGWTPRLPDILTDPTWSAGRYSWYPTTATGRYTTMYDGAVFGGSGVPGSAVGGCRLAVGGGACCSNCAVGKKCAGEPEVEVGFVSDADIDVYGKAVQQLTAEIDDVAQKARTLGATSAPVSMFQSRWTQFVMKSNEWISDHTGFLSRTYSDASFADLRNEYGLLQAEWKKMLPSLNKEVAVIPATSASADIALGTPPAGPVLPSPEDLGKYAKTIAIVAAVGLGAIYILPPLLGRLLPMLRKST